MSIRTQPIVTRGPGTMTGRVEPSKPMHTQSNNDHGSRRPGLRCRVAVMFRICGLLPWALAGGPWFGLTQAMAADQARLMIQREGAGVSIGVFAGTGSVWQVEYTESLGGANNWRPLGGVSLSNSSFGLITDHGASAAAGRFYRASQPALSLGELFYLRFDGNTLGADGEVPSSQSGVAYVAGKAGQAGHVGANGRVRYPIAGNLNPQEGTIQFWVRPDWRGDTNITRVFFEAGDNFNRGLMISKDSASFLRLIQWGDDPGTGTVEFDVERGVGYSVSGWQALEWHHVAVCWQASTRWLALYVDGEQVRSATNGITLSSLSTDYFVLGAEIDNGQPAYAAFDEFKIFAAMRTANQIFQDYQLHRAVH